MATTALAFDAHLSWVASSRDSRFSLEYFRIEEGVTTGRRGELSLIDQPIGRHPAVRCLLDLLRIVPFALIAAVVPANQIASPALHHSSNEPAQIIRSDIPASRANPDEAVEQDIMGDVADVVLRVQVARAGQRNGFDAGKERVELSLDGQVGAGSVHGPARRGEAGRRVGVVHAARTHVASSARIYYCATERD
jgi:hypothetical protein